MMNTELCTSYMLAADAAIIQRLMCRAQQFDNMPYVYYTAIMTLTAYVGTGPVVHL